MRMSIYDGFDEFDVGLYHLIFIANSIENTVKAFSGIIDKADDEHEKALYVATSSIVLIQTVSFLDEYHHHIKSTDEDVNTTINAIKKAVKPAVAQINEWKEIDVFRNNVLAHNLRDRKKMISVFERGLSSYDVPKTGNELLVLYNCVSMIKKTFESAFRTKLQLFQNALDQSPQHAKESRFKSREEAMATILRITDEINANILKLKQENGVSLS